MSLTFLADEKNTNVIIVEWFRDPVQFLEYACAPVREIDYQAFRIRCSDIVTAHFAEYSSRRVRRSEVPPLFDSPKQAKIIRHRLAIRVTQENETTIGLMPLYSRKGGLHGYVPLPSGTKRYVPNRCPNPAFFQAFEAAIKEIRESESTE